MPDLKALIWEVLMAEIAALRADPQPLPREERVRIASSHDLTEFALSVLRRADDTDFVAAVRQGRLRFTPEEDPVWQAPPSTPMPSTPVPSIPVALVTMVPAAVPEILKALITERDIAATSPEQTRLRIGKNSRITPLARDEIRRRGIRIERNAT